MDRDARRINWPSVFRTRTAAVALLAGVLLGVGCPAKPVTKPVPFPGPAPGPGPQTTIPPGVFSPNSGEPVKAATPAKGGPGSIGVVILLDTSGSMQAAPNDKTQGNRPKHELANEALTEILRQTAEWAKAHPDKTLNLSITTFSDRSRPVLLMGRFDDAVTREAVGRIPTPHGGTAIGAALQDGWQTLKPVGAERQYILCITDGANTVPPTPQAVLPDVTKDSGGKVEIHFIAFDVAGNLFDYVKGHNGHVVEAANLPQLKTELKRIFEKRILGEGD